MSGLQAAMALLAAGVVLPLALPGNLLRVGVSLLAQALACGCVLTQTVPVLFGGPMVAGFVEWSYPIERIDVRLDPLGAFFLSFSLPMTLLGSVYAVGYLASDMRRGRHVGTHFALLGVVQISFVVVYTVQNAFAFLAGWEMAALAAWLLVIWNDRDQKVRFAGFNYLISTHLSLLFLVAAITIMEGATNSFQFQDFQEFLRRPGASRGITFVLLLFSFGLKSAFFPGHTWLPRAHAAAPAHVSALMSGVIHKAGLFGMLKLILMIGRPEPWMGWLLLGGSAISAFMGVLYTIMQRDLKRLLGYSSTENVGIAGMGFGAGCLGLAYDMPTLAVLGFAGGILHVLNHALFKCLLFYGAGSVYRFTHTVDLEKLGGLLKPMRWTGPFFLAASLASAALPPFNGFVSEFLVYMALAWPEPGLGLARIPLLFALAALALVGGISALSVTRAFGLAFLGSPRDPRHIHPEAREHPLMILPMAIHLAGVVALGLVPWIGLAVVEGPTELLLHSAGMTSHSVASELMPLYPLHGVARLFAIALGLFVLLSVLRRLLLPPSDRRHVTWGCGYTLPNTRMQYTGASFSHPMAAVFRDLLTVLRREQLPKGVFPQDGKLETHAADTVEYGIFDALAGCERMASALLARLPETTRGAVWLGMAAVVLMAAWVVWK